MTACAWAATDLQQVPRSSRRGSRAWLVGLKSHCIGEPLRTHCVPVAVPMLVPSTVEVDLPGREMHVARA